MLDSTRFPLAAALALVSVVACSSVDETPSKDDEVSTAIIEGEVDVEHDAVVMLSMGKADGTFSRCSGTIVKTDPATKVGWVLTAAHCIDDVARVQVVTGATLGSPDSRTFQVLDFTPHPNYTGATTSVYDIGVVRILGVDASTPAIPLYLPDGLQNGVKVTSVGYGRTTPMGVPESEANRLRRSVGGTVRALRPGSVGVRYEGGSICKGDSGGPVLIEVEGKKFVAGVHSFVVGNCIGIGYSARPAAFGSFLQPILSTPPAALSCGQCKQAANSGDQACVTARRACFGDAECGGYYRCVMRCTTADCANDCRARFPQGVGPFLALRNCPCTECADACSEDATCAATPRCGISLGQTDCARCMESSCCDEVAACGGDGACYACLGSGSAPECATNPLRQGMFACRNAKCAAQCGATP